MTGLSWFWIALMASVAPLVGGIIAFPLWRTRQTMLGNITGTAGIFAVAFGLICREDVELDRMTQSCLDAGITCWPEPSAFTRFAIYAFIGLAEAFGLFAVSLRVEQQIRNRNYAPEWR